jgi:hypothetical protein
MQARKISSKSVQVAEELLKPVTIILMMSLLIHGIYHWQEWAGSSECAASRFWIG